MSNFHEFGTGRVQIRSATMEGTPGMVIGLTDLVEPMQMDVKHDVEPMDSIPLHSTVLFFPEKAALDRLIRILQERSDGWK